MELGERIKILLKRKGMSQNELARKAGLSSSGMSTILKGAYDPRLSSLVAIAQALDCRVVDLIEDEAPQRGERLSAGERHLLETWRSSDEIGREDALALLERHAIKGKEVAAS